MSDKIARLGIERDNDLMYYIKGGDVWASPRKQPGKPKGKARKIAPIGIDLDYSKYLYFVDGDGDVARKARALGGGGRKAKTKLTKKVARSASTGHFVTEATVKRHPSTTVEETVGTSRGKKSVAQLEREIEECLSRPPGTGNGADGTVGNGAPRNGKRSSKGKGKGKGKGKKASR